MKYIVSLYLSRLSLSAMNWTNFQAASGFLLCFEIASQSVQFVVTCAFFWTGSAITSTSFLDGLLSLKSRTVSWFPSCIATRFEAMAPTFAVGAEIVVLLATLSWLNSLLKKSSASTASGLLITTLPSGVKTSPPLWNRNQTYCCQIGLALKPVTRNLSPSRWVLCIATCSSWSQVFGAWPPATMSLRYISVWGALSTGTPYVLSL